MSDSPASVIVHGDGDEVAVKTGEAAAAALPVAGQDGGTARIVKVDAEGRPIVTGDAAAPMPIAGVVVGSITSGTISGTVSANQGLAGAHERRWMVGLSDGDDFVGTQTNPIKVGDDFSTGEILAQQIGANAVLTFTFSESMNQVYIESSGIGLVCRVDPFGGTPSSTLGIPCRDEEVLKLPVIVSVVRVYAPTGTTVNVWGFRR